MIAKLVCEACNETLDLLRVHGGSDEVWGRIVLCREQIDDLRKALRHHTAYNCTHYQEAAAERKRKLLDRP